jgi:transcriptional regulator with XRE-family HTH domain
MTETMCDKEVLGPVIREARINTGLTQQEAAQELGWSPQTQNRYETGARGPSLAHLYRIADLFDLHPGSLKKGNVVTNAEIRAAWEAKGVDIGDFHRQFRFLLQGRTTTGPRTVDLQNAIDHWAEMSKHEQDSVLKFRLSKRDHVELLSAAELLGLSLSDTIRLAIVVLRRVSRSDEIGKPES